MIKKNIGQIEKARKENKRWLELVRTKKKNSREYLRLEKMGRENRKSTKRQEEK
jgi:hypothetical protein